MKQIFYIIIISFLFINGCDKNSDPTSNNVQEFDDHLELSGSISNHNSSFNKIFVQNITGSSVKIETGINSNGTFKLSIPNPTDDLLSQYIPYSNITLNGSDSTIYADSIKFDNPDVRFKRYDISVSKNEGDTLHAMPVNESELSITNGLASEGDYFVSYYYFKSHVSIYGNYTIRHVSQDSTYEITTNYNLQLKKGWNKIITKLVANRKFFTIYEIRNTDLISDKGKWLINAKSCFPKYMPRF